MAPELKQLAGQYASGGSVQELAAGLMRVVARQCGAPLRPGADPGPDCDAVSRQLAELLEQVPGQPDREGLVLQLLGQADHLLDRYSVASPRQFWHHCFRYVGECGEKYSGGQAQVAVTFIDHGQQWTLPLKVEMVNQNGTVLNKSRKALVAYQQRLVSKMAEQRQPNGLDCNEVDLKFYAVRDVRFRSCWAVAFLDVSHTFLMHLDVRQLVGLRELKLTNTCIKRLNLAGQGRLAVLFCNYTQVEYLVLAGKRQLGELRTEYSARLRLSGLTAGCEASFDGQQVLDGYRCRGRAQEKRESQISFYPQMRAGAGRVDATVPRRCHDLADREIKLCTKLAMHGTTQPGPSGIDYLDIAGFPALEQLVIQHLACERFCIASLQSLAQLRLSQLATSSVLIAGFPSLRVAEVTYCHKLEEIRIADCGEIEILDIQATNVSRLDVAQLGRLRKLNVEHTGVEWLDLSGNAELRELSIANTRISRLDLSRLQQLRTLQAHRADISELDVAANPMLEELRIAGSRVSRLDLSQVPQLRVLSVFETAISQLDVSHNAKLQILQAFGTRISQLDVRPLTELQSLQIEDTDIKQIDLSGNGRLSEAWLSSDCRVTQCRFGVLIRRQPAGLRRKSVTTPIGQRASQ